ncbi:hypothetical protein BC826DRAFT_461051 [Russula brevipes]|nr:hypothetical protein BC826DRAFT_461051 [Russula brevipes]
MGNRSTLALRIQFNGEDGQRVTGQDDIQSLLPWLRDILSGFRLPHPKSTNVMKSSDVTNAIDMYWDVEPIHQVMVNSVISRCDLIETSALQVRSINFLMVFLLPADMRVIHKRESPIVVKFGPPDNSTTNRTSNSRPSPAFEAALLAIFESVGLSIPTPVEDLACASNSPRSVIRIYELL